MHTPFMSRLFVVVFQEINVYILLNMPMFVGSESFISLPSFMFISAVVSEIHELNQNKKEKNSEIGYFQFITFPAIYNRLAAVNARRQFVLE